jgi:ER membrane protein complex subunit 1
VVIGLDLFLSRVAPAKEFDRLNEDFNFVALVGATVFLTVATVGSGWFSNRKELARAWR